MLHTRGRAFIDEKGNEIILRGQNIGNWMLIEPNMFGTPGAEHRLRTAILNYAGEKKEEVFWTGLLDKWFTEKDVAFLAEIGSNSVRLPFNYRHLEDDMDPFKYKEDGFDRLKQAVDWCEKYGIRPVLDLNASQGYQSCDWH